MACIRWHALCIFSIAPTLVGCIQPPDRLGSTTDQSPASYSGAPGDEQLSAAQLVQMEVYLRQLGYLAGEPDGLVDMSTRAAIGAFQAGDGSVPTGNYSYALLQSLEQSAAERMAGSVVEDRPAVATGPRQSAGASTATAAAGSPPAASPTASTQTTAARVQPSPSPAPVASSAPTRPRPVNNDQHIVFTGGGAGGSGGGSGGGAGGGGGGAGGGGW